MKIEKAIKILDNFDDPFRLFTVAENKKAAKLGIEALKREEKRRHFAVPDKVDLLPGETKE